MRYHLSFKKPAALIDAYVVENAGLAAVNGLYTLVENQTSYGGRKVYSNGSCKLGFLDEDLEWYGWAIMEPNRSFNGVTGDPKQWSYYYGPELDKNSTIGPESTNGNWSVGRSPATEPIPIIRQATTKDVPPLDKSGVMLNVSGCVEGSETTYYVNQSPLMNGNYYLIDKTATGSDRIWKHEIEEYYIKAVSSTKWAIIDTERTTSVAVSASVYLKDVETTNDPYQSDGSSYTTWYYGPNHATHIKVIAKNI